ncbi:MAG: IS1 family transposase [Bacteroidota bacterium]
MEKRQCPYCKGPCTKNGRQRGKQRYKCKKCLKTFQLQYVYQAYAPHADALLKSLLKEGCGVRSISRIMGISTKTILSRMLKISHKLKAHRLGHPYANYEMDELWSYIGSKANTVWITYAIERETRGTVGFFVGSKTKANIRPLVNNLLLRNPKHIYTDRLNIYPALVPKTIHRFFRYSTNHIERKNLTLRTHIKRLSRKTICFSKKKKYLEAHLRIYFWG